MDIDKERAAFEAWSIAKRERMSGHTLDAAQKEYLLRRLPENRENYNYAPSEWPAFQGGYRAALGSQDTAPPAAVPAPSPVPLFDRKLADLEQRGYQVIGRILHKDGEYALFDSSCRWLTTPQYQRLMHEQDGSLFSTPRSPAAEQFFANLPNEARQAAAPAQAVDALPVLPGCLADRLFEAISMARDSAENDGSNGRIRKWEATAADLRAALAAQPAAEKAGDTSESKTVQAIDSLLRGQVNDPDPLAPMCPGTASIVTTYGLAAGLLREVKKLRAEISQVRAASVATWKCAGCGSVSADACIGVGCGMCEAEPDAAPVANAGQAQDENADAEACSSCGLTMGESRTLAALRQQAAQAVAVPDGWRLVPIEPTKEMIWACDDKWVPRIALPFFVAGYKCMVEAAPLPQQVAQTEDQPTLPHHTSRDAYFKMTPERKAALDADMTQLERRIAEHRKSRDRRTHDEPVAEERRHGDRRHAERRDCED